MSEEENKGADNIPPPHPESTEPAVANTSSLPVTPILPTSVPTLPTTTSAPPEVTTTTATSPEVTTTVATSPTPTMLAPISPKVATPPVLPPTSPSLSTSPASTEVMATSTEKTLESAPTSPESMPPTSATNGTNGAAVPNSHNIRANQYACCADPKTIRTEEFNFCKKKIRELKLPMRLIQASLLQEDNRLVFFFTAPERVDFRELLRILRHQYYGIRIELRQIGQRDAASLLGGVGICGQELCCCKFLRTFSPITAKIAKKVGPTPNPAMYCGLCGRLCCCLKYEEGGVGQLLVGVDVTNEEWEGYDDD